MLCVPTLSQPDGRDACLHLLDEVLDRGVLCECLVEEELLEVGHQVLPAYVLGQSVRQLG
ncbi:hypothetical protein DPMN_178258 [Dreissena polymorpha]|uniref:Uncharacterized protein n=1 Tax=Dreissena polymorpha TaxID=45954 RepID=A0A9D4IJQ0_DREPO|nr:hypothetical protein DPMN_178258 [Dreissena polymorpha]